MDECSFFTHYYESRQCYLWKEKQRPRLRDVKDLNKTIILTNGEKVTKQVKAKEVSVSGGISCFGKKLAMNL